MSYQPTIWKDRIVEKPRTFDVINNPDGSITLVPKPGTVLQEGTPVNAANMNKLEQGLVSHMAEEAPHSGHETPAGAQAKAEAAAGAVQAQLDAHKSEVATETELGHIRLSDITITDSTTGARYKWGVENGRVFLERVV